MGKLLSKALAQKKRRDSYVTAAERAVDLGRFGRARRLFKLAGYRYGDIVTFYDEAIARAVFGLPEE